MNTTKTQKRRVRQLRTRVRSKGTADRPRLAIYRSLRGLFGQVINDDTGKTLASVHSKTAVVETDAGDRSKRVAQSYLLGKALAQKAKEAGIERVVFDRAGNAYHGRVQAFADGARDGGLQF